MGDGKNYFRFLSDDMIAEYDEQATPGEKAELEEWLGAARVHNRQSGKRHIVSMTLFWKHVNADHPGMARPNRHRLMHSRRLGLVKRFDPYESYVLTFLPTDARWQLLPLDIEFTTWANPRSEVVYFPAGGGCC